MRGLLLGGALACAAALACAQDAAPAPPAATATEAEFVERQIESDEGPLRFFWRALTATAPGPDATIAPDTALNTSWLLHRHLARGAIEDAALLSNAPRRRYEELKRYLEGVGKEAFRQVFGEYFVPGNRPVAEAAIGPHRLIVWHLQNADRLAGEYYVEIEGRFMIDDGPSVPRNRLRRVLASLRAGQLPASLPADPDKISE
ncbi:MAG: hypothetical protein IPK29_16135 [Betaproteobacteria bacterium]|nr:hypothetical protein [Betaproteobacteria bacterium]